MLYVNVALPELSSVWVCLGSEPLVELTERMTEPEGVP